MNVPAVMVSAPAIPTIEFAPSCKRVPFTVALKRSCVPVIVVVPIKLIVPAVAVSLPLPERLDLIEKLTAELTALEILKALNVVDPAPPITADAPLKVIVPPVAENEPLVVRFEPITNDAVVVTLPDITTLDKLMLLPPIVFDVPEKVMVPPALWVNVPVPVVARFPVNVMLLDEQVTPFPATVTLLKFWTPVPLIKPEARLNRTAPVLPLYVPLFVQLPPTT